MSNKRDRISAKEVQIRHLGDPDVGSPRKKRARTERPIMRTKIAGSTKYSSDINHWQQRCKTVTQKPPGTVDVIRTGTEKAGKTPEAMAQSPKAEPRLIVNSCLDYSFRGKLSPSVNDPSMATFDISCFRKLNRL